MCGRFSSHVGSDILVKRYEVTDNRTTVNPSYNVAPASQIRVITKENPTVLSNMYWNYIPNDLRYFDRSRPIINARSERLLELKMYSESFKQRRCLIPINGFYEWKKPDQINQAKTPYYIRMIEEETFSLAGIYSNQHPINKFLKSDDKNIGPEITTNQSCAILTTSPNTLIELIHNRMPVIIVNEFEKVWLNPAADIIELMELLQPISSELIRAYPVSTFVNNIKNNNEKCIQEIDDVGLYRQKLGLDQEQSSLDDFF